MGPTLWGLGAAEADARTDYRSTRKWFAIVTAEQVVHADTGKK
ncbi:Uncharacterised protein [Mycobacteroides abscessus subsp. abscessus]|nr:Uncharacterised protein [Mycobacteroides abscessus subsp. abscessus]SLF30712.1 Uncharacterised protein [Mycobacteroides abscessus subsp. abscessus]SLF35075.1 Uncharacterised protein [Mycobacteroides abscessus subsp. abscessus]SLF96088.1 Uncharacterised protein [Mycobacteroides abscessus subsp. abscessus]SLH28742.1 Uncharacterised protein [Mycobacteroides abscessus subsp. abscessus]